MMYKDMTKDQLKAAYAAELKVFEGFKKQGLSLDMTRGKPATKQLEICTSMFKILAEEGRSYIVGGADARNYGGLDGTPAAKELFAELFDVPTSQVIVSDNSSLQCMYRLVQHGMQFGYSGQKPWNGQAIKFLCPAPGYDRHFAICKAFDIEMITIPMDDKGPDMDMVEKLLAADDSIKGMWCIPKYSNPTGVVYSDEVVARLAKMKAAPDFRIFWDNAYMVHGFYETDDVLKNIFTAAKAAGNEDRIFSFASTSKITFAGGGIAAMAASEKSVAEIKSRLQYETIGPNKLIHFAHTEYIKNKAGILEIMKKHADIMRPKFELIIGLLKDIDELGIAEYTKPRGGYFISVNVLEGCAKRVVELSAEAGVKLTGAGATYPYGKDPKNSNIRVAPSVPPIEELEPATKIFINAIKLAALEKLLA